ncbi:hypothetical protein N7492_001244 [Penicillium capsulatum]|uniref:ER-bound oxygenase mpaB/mpaB'/Rubber oxygenase catalytic domain-containing protein n=1 Tax=Penicillium capsulatum TaxID=69766 RepID=A0A9W9IR62_9EURO|nr:hypothetical protein N7492_001244 [Penicillium capsulatum]KAJ6129698.1 hypothetical protein N7512_002478 [Penicillium capsulatum]
MADKPTFKKPANGDLVTIYNHQFRWSDKHFTPDELFPLRQQVDDLGVATYARLQEIIAKEKESNPSVNQGRADLYTVLEKHHTEDEILQKFWEEVTTVPDWVDWGQIEQGQKFIYRNLPANLTGLALQGFLGGTATIAGGSEVLARTGGFTLRIIPRRFLETFMWLLQITMSMEGMKPGGQGFISTVRVRLLHAAVRQRVIKLIEQDPSYFNEEEFGTPANMRDAIHSTVIFCCMPLFRQLPIIGITPEPEETADFLAFFRYIAYIMGNPQSYFDGVEQSKATMESVMLCEPPPTETSKAICMNFTAALQDAPGINISRPMLEAGCRIMSGDKMADLLGFPRRSVFYHASYRGYFRLLVWINVLQRWIPPFDRWVIRKSKEIVITNVFGAPILKGAKFDMINFPALNKFTKAEPKKPLKSWFRPVETIGFLIFLAEIFFYLVVVGALGKTIASWYAVR